MSDEPEVLDQHPVEARLLRLVLAAQHGGRMERGDRLLRPARGKEPAAVPEQAEIGSDDRARRRRAEADEHLGLDRRDLGHQARGARRSEEHTSELQSPCNLVCRLLLEKKKKFSNSTKVKLQAHMCTT